MEAVGLRWIELNLGAPHGREASAVRQVTAQDAVRNYVRTVRRAVSIPLAVKLGRLAMELCDGRADRITLAYLGALAERDTRLLTLAALNGAFQGRCDQPVNYVNAALIASERGIEVVEERRLDSRGYTNLLQVVVQANGEREWLTDIERSTVAGRHVFWTGIIRIQLAM